MPNRTSKTGSELFIVDNSDDDWQVHRYLKEWCSLSKSIDIATGYFEIGALLALDGEWQNVNEIRILMGDHVSMRTKEAFERGLRAVKEQLDTNLEREKQGNDFLSGVPAIVDALRQGTIRCRVYRKDKFHAKAYITHARQDVIGSFALTGSSNLTRPGITENVELNVQIAGTSVRVLQEWYEEHWDEAEDVTPSLLQTVERHVRERTPFEVYARSLQEYLRGHEMTADEWEQAESNMYPALATYQKRGYHGLLKRGHKYGGALLCDGVGLGKTYIGLMLIERLVKHENKRVVLFVPKAARESVWESRIRRYMPEILGGFLSFRIFNQTDLRRKNQRTRDELKQMREQADVVVIDEAHHFRNTGVRGEREGERQSRYWEMFDLCENKEVYMLTATPVNNRLTDFQHMLELFSRRQPDYFNCAPLGIHSLPGHIRTLEKRIDQYAQSRDRDTSDELQAADGTDTNLAEAEDVLRDDQLFEELVVQRSRSYVKSSLREEDHDVQFPQPAVPRVVPYSVKQTYGKILSMVEQAFHRDKPLFSLAMYYPWDFYHGQKDLTEQEIAMRVGRQKQVVRLIRTSFLKRFESSIQAFEASCRTLMKKLVAFYFVHAEGRHDQDRLEKWLARHKDVTGYDPEQQHTLFSGATDLEMAEEDVVESEFFEQAYQDKLNSEEFDIPGLLSDTMEDLNTIVEFLKELRGFEPKQDKKLQALKQLLQNRLKGLSDVGLQREKVLIFTEFKDTARYLADQLQQAGIEGVAEIDSESSGTSRGETIRRFAPYYNESSSSKLSEEGLDEIRILISTDVLAEGLNLQDATRLINYDLHWNPVRLMQRIGRIDRRMDPEVEQRIIRDHPEHKKQRGWIQYYNFLPPEELNELLTLYHKVTHKTLRISKTFGIEHGQLLHPEDDYDLLRDFVKQCEGTQSQSEILSLEFQRLVREHPELEVQLDNLPNRVFSGKETLSEDARGVFFCYARPGQDAETGEWSEQAGDVKWYLYDLATEKIHEAPSEIANQIRSTRETPRVCEMSSEDLIAIRKKMDKHLKNTYLKRVQAPAGVNPTLRAWMELN